jgi:hypothetical protein
MVIHTRPEMSHPRQDMTQAHWTAPTQFVEANGIRKTPAAPTEKETHHD